MAVDKKWIGKTYPPVRYEVGSEKTKEYAWAVDDGNPLFREEEAARAKGFQEVLVPPLFAVVYAREAMRQVLLDSELKLNLPMLVHGGQEFEFYKLPQNHDVITTTAKVADIYEKQSKSGRSLDFVVVETESVNQGGEKICKGTWTFIIRG